MKTYFKLLILVLLVASCDETESTTFDPDNGQTFVSFNSSSSDLQVLVDDSGSIDIQVNSTTVTSTDRQFNVSVSASSSAAAENYNVPSTVTIPADSHIGTLTISGTDVSIETTQETIVLELTSQGGDVQTGSEHTVRIFQVCPVPSDYFTGMYLIEQTTPQIDGYSLSHNSIVEVVAIDDTTRSFATEAYITYCSGTFFDFQVNLVCNELIVPSQDTTCRCANAADWWGPATTPESFDVSDDSVIFLTFTDDAQSDCGDPAQTTYKFTKQ